MRKNRYLYQQTPFLSSRAVNGMIGGMFLGLLALLWFSSSTPNPSAQPLVPAADSPNPWFWLSRYNRTMTRAEFEAALPLFDPTHSLRHWIAIDDEGMTFYSSLADRRVPQFYLEFAPAIKTAASFPKTYRTPAEFRALPKSEAKPLHGLRIAIDPGHIGGAWGQIEDRSTYYFGVGRIQEGDMNLITAKILEKELTDLGAEVFLTRHDTNPVTTVRPEQLKDEAMAALLQARPAWSAIPASLRPITLHDHVELMTHLLFERKYEFLARAQKIRQEFRPDLTVVLYINATPSSGRAHLIGDNQNIFFVEGAYTADEIAQDDERLRLCYKILDRVTPVEHQVADRIAQAFTTTTGLRPVGYGNSTTTELLDPDNFYVVARNLGANRQYDGPVVTTEPYYMNNRIVAQRLVAGDYDGERIFGGRSYRSIFREYADCVTEGLIASYGPAVRPAPKVASASNDSFRAK